VSPVYPSPPHMPPEERELLLDTFGGSRIAPLGPHVHASEAEFVGYVDVPHAAALSSGTAALRLALLHHDVGPGDVVLCSSFTLAATASVIVYVGAEPGFVDAAADTWCIDPDLVGEAILAERAAGRRVAAVIAVDLYGLMPDYDRLQATCAEHEVPLIEDAAEAPGSTRNGQKAGIFGSCAAFSFNGEKIIATSGGGMLVSHDADLVIRARHLATQARQPVTHCGQSDLGSNYPLSNLSAAVDRDQLRHLDEGIAARRTHRADYEEQLGGLPGIRFAPVPEGQSPSHWPTWQTIDPDAFGSDSEAVRQRLAEENTEARPLWKPTHQQPVLADCRSYGVAVSDEQLLEVGPCLPSGSALTARVVEGNGGRHV